VKRATVAAFHGFSQDLEGVVRHPYCDAFGLVTTGMGLLCNTLPEFTMLPWKRPDGTDATRDEVIAAWAAVRSHAEEDKLKGGMYFARYTTIRLDIKDVHKLSERKLTSNWLLLLRRFPDADEWPADAQLFLCSWAWAVGPAAPYPKMSAYLRQKDFDAAAEECTITANGKVFGTLVTRNARNKVLLRNAARVLSHHLDEEKVWWPEDLTRTIREAETQPQMENPISEDDGGASRRQATLDVVGDIGRGDDE
jgi:GH24 family phage-related lysozyme (muramidase)